MAIKKNVECQKFVHVFSYRTSIPVFRDTFFKLFRLLLDAVAVSFETVTIKQQLFFFWIIKNKQNTKGFDKSFLKAGETKTIQIEIHRDSFAYSDKSLNKWSVKSSVYKIQIGKSCSDIQLQVDVNIK